MLPFLAPLISGGASLLGSIFSSNTSAQNTQDQIASQEAMQAQSENFNANQAQITRDYQTQMSNTAYQRASADMKAAGLNPMIMANGGGSASSPSGATASIGTPSVPMPQTRSALAGLGDAVNQGLSAAVTSKTLDAMTTEIAKKEMDTKLASANIDVANQEARKKNFEGTNTALDTAQHQLEATSASDVLRMAPKVREGINQGKFQQPQFGGVVGGVVGSAKEAVDRAKRYFGSDSGASFSDKFDAVYGNSNSN